MAAAAGRHRSGIVGYTKIRAGTPLSSVLSQYKAARIESGDLGREEK
jgi:hypothetical protein